MFGQDGKSGLSPDDVARVARSVVTEQDIRDLVRTAIEEGTPQARKFLQDVLFPRDSSSVQDVKWKRVVYCTFEEYNEIEKLKTEVSKLESKVEKLEEELAVYEPERFTEN